MLHTEQLSKLLYASISSLNSSLDPPTFSSFSLRRLSPAICSSHCCTLRSAVATADASSVLLELNPAACRCDASSASLWSLDVACNCLSVCVCSSMRTLNCEDSSRARASSTACSCAALSICAARCAAACALPPLSGTLSGSTHHPTQFHYKPNRPRLHSTRPFHEGGGAFHGQRLTACIHRPRL